MDSKNELIAKDCAFKNIIHLSPKLNKIFWILFYASPNVVSYERIIDIVYDDEIALNTLRMAICRLKKILQIDLIKNISGFGYKMNAEKKYF